jgi:hypothetical protein
MNNHNSPHITPQPLQHTPIPHDLVLFSSPPLFLNLHPTTVPQHVHSIASFSSSENCHSPATRLSFSENHQSPNALPSSENCNRHSTIHTKAFLKITLPFTKDIPILTSKHNWEPWHTAVWTLIDCSNLLRHVHDSMLLGALYDPDLELLFPPVITCALLQHEKDLYLDWWNHNKIAAYILTSHLSPAVLGTIPIANSQLGQ